MDYWGNWWGEVVVGRNMGRDEKVSLMVVGLSVLVGLVGQGLFYGAGLGVNVVLVVLVMLGMLVGIRRQGKLSKVAWFWMVPIVLGALGILWDDSSWGRGLSTAMMLSGMGMMVLWKEGVRPEGALVALLGSLFRWIVLPFEGVLEAAMCKWPKVQLTEKGVENRKSLVRGVLLSVPLLIGFGALLAMADPVFGRFLDLDISLNGAELMVRGFLFAGFAPFAAGLLWRFVGRKSLFATESKPLATRIGGIEYGMVTGGLAVLFGMFALVQARYLFGGDEVVLQTAGLTYSEYARRGFFELVAAVGLAVPVLLTGLSVLDKGVRKQKWVSVLATVYLGFLGVMLGSAVSRMGLYVDVYGLTELRYFTSAAMGWLAAVILAIGYLTWARRLSQAGTWLVGTAMVAVTLSLGIGPAKTIASVNLERMKEGRDLDLDYLVNLGSGAVGPLLASDSGLEEDEREKVRAALVDRVNESGDWREWTFVGSVARKTVYED